MNTLTPLLIVLSLPCKLSRFLFFSYQKKHQVILICGPITTFQVSHLFLSSFISSGVTGQSMESIPSSPVVKKPGDTLSLSCRGSGFSFGCCVMIWVREPAGKPLELIGSGFSTSSRNSYASSLRGRVEISRDDSNSMVYLIWFDSNLRPEDSAIDYCAKEKHSG